MVAEAISQHPREFVGLVTATVAVFAIVTNALFLQKGPHPAPIFATRPLLQQQAALVPRLQSAPSNLVAEPGNQGRLQLITNIQRELARKGFYDGPADGIWGAKTDTAVRDFIQVAGLKANPEASDGLLRAIAAMLAALPTNAAKLAALGRPLSWERVAEIAGAGAVGRPHIISQHDGAAHQCVRSQEPNPARGCCRRKASGGVSSREHGRAGIRRTRSETET